MKLSYNEACCRERSDLEQDLRLCEAAGFDGIEIWYNKAQAYLQDHSMADLQTFFASSHLKPYSINAIYTYADFLSDRDDPARAEALKELTAFCCQLCQAIGCDRIVVVPPLYTEAENRAYTDPWDKILADNTRIFSWLADFAAPYGVKIGLEIVGAPRSSIRTVAQANAVLQAADRPNLGYTIDLYNLYLYHKTNDFSAIQQCHAEKIHIVHLMGGEACPEEEFLQKNRTFPDRGVLDVGNYLRHLRAAGYDGCVSIELFRQDLWDMEPADGIALCYAATKAALEQEGLLSE